MDPVTHGLLGGIVAQTLAKKAFARTAFLCGVIGGLSPDLDIIIKSTEDPLLLLEYHRHFTHSLAFIPFGGLIVALGMYFLLNKKLPFRETYIFSTLGYATHGLLDACTTYGTLLYWPFSDKRVAWDLIAIIDPMFTITLLVFILLSLFRKSKILARTGIALAMLYLGAGLYQHGQAEAKILELANERGHKIERHQIMPTMGNLVLWRSIYEYDNRFYVDAVYTSPFGHNYLLSGGSTDKLNVEWEFPDITAIQRRDIKRFSYFANGFVAMHPDEPDVIGDFRYATLPHQISPLWGIKITEGSNKHVRRVSFRKDRRKSLEEFWLMLDGSAEAKQ